MSNVHVIYKKGTIRPYVAVIQILFNLKLDVIFGKKTEQAVKQFQENYNLKPDGIVGVKTQNALRDYIQSQPSYIKNNLHRYLTAERIAIYEHSNKQDAMGYGSIHEINDGAGKNYGFMCLNSMGSVEYFYSLTGKHIIDVIGTVEGNQLQMYYFNHFYSKARAFINTYEVDLLPLLLDNIIQCGFMYKPSRKIPSLDARNKKLIKKYVKNTQTQKDIINTLKILQDKLFDVDIFRDIVNLPAEVASYVLLAIYTQICSQRWRDYVEQRRLIDINNVGVLYGDFVDMHYLTVY